VFFFWTNYVLGTCSKYLFPSVVTLMCYIFVLNLLHYILMVTDAGT